MNKTPTIKEIISRWPTRQDLADDAGVDLFAVHRWFQRGSVNARHDAALINGAKRRKIKVTLEEFSIARSCHAEQLGHASVEVQPRTQEKTRGAVQ